MTPMKKQPLLILLICFISGIIFQEYLMVRQVVLFSFMLISGISLFSIFINKASFQRIKYYSLGIFFFSIGVFVHSLNSNDTRIPVLKEKENIVFQLSKKLNSNEKNRRYIVEIIAIPSAEIKDFEPIKTVLSIPKEQEILDFNHFYDADVYIHQPEETKNNFQFDYKKYLSRQDVFLQAYLPNELLKAKKTEVSFADKIRQKRLEILNKINQTSLSPKIQEFLKGIILADRTEMDAETVKDFNQTGLTHLLAISGSHMVIIFWIVLMICNQVFPFRLRKFSIITSLVFIWCFAIFIDYGSSVMRSCLMISCYYIMVLLQRKSDLLHSSALSAFIILIVDSNQLFDVGFQLSYVAVVGIWWLTVPIKKLFFRSPKYWTEKFFYEITAMTLAAQIATLPLAIYYFHQFSLVSFFANVIIIPLSEILIISSLLMVVLIAFGIKNDYLFRIFDVSIDYVLQSIHWFSGFDGLMNKNIALNLIELSVLMIAIYLLRYLLKEISNTKHYLKLAFCLLLFFGLRLGFNSYNYEKQELLVHNFYKDKIISVKDKDKVVFWLKENKNKDKIKSFVINPYLVSRRLKHYQIQYIPEDSEGFVYRNKIHQLE